MRITKLESFLVNSGLRNYLFLRLTTDTGLTGVGEASLEWQELTVQTLLHEWVEDRVLGVNPFDVEKVFGDLIRDQYQGGSTVLTAISGVEIACWDLIGKACGQPVYQLLGGQARDRYRLMPTAGTAERPLRPNMPKRLAKLWLAVIAQ